MKAQRTTLGLLVPPWGEIREKESPTSLPDEEATMIAYETLPDDVQDANWQYTTGHRQVYPREAHLCS